MASPSVIHVAVPSVVATILAASGPPGSLLGEAEARSRLARATHDASAIYVAVFVAVWFEPCTAAANGCVAFGLDP